MADIKLITEETDLSGLRKPLGWDLVVDGLAYDVYRVEDHNHSIGGRWGENNFWACPAGATPTFENLIQYDGDAPTWGIMFDRNNYIKDKWDQTSVEVNGSCWITRNGKPFISIMSRDADYGLAKAQVTLVELLEQCPLDLRQRNWKEEAVGTKIWYRNDPAIIERVTSNNDLWIVPDGIDKFSVPVSWSISDWDEYEDGLVAEILSPEIKWFRN